MKQPSDGRIRENFLTNERLVLNSSRMLLVGMSYCLGLGLQKIAEQIFKGWDLDYLPWLVMLVALEAIFSTGQVRRVRDLELSITVYRLVEWVVILALLKAYFYTRHGWDQLWDDITNMRPRLLDRVFDPEFMLTALALLLIWLLVTWTMNDLYEIESSLLLLDSAGYERYFSDTTVIRKSIVQRLFGVGLLLVIVSGLGQVNWDALFAGVFDSPRIQNWHVLAYFVCLILLLGQTYFATLRAGWAWERIHIDGHIARLWLGYGLLVLLLIGFVASLLPTRYSLNFFETLLLLFNFFISILFSVFFYIAMLVGYLLAWLFSFFGGEKPPSEMPEIEQVAQEETIEEIVQTATGAEIIQSIAFWAFLVLLIIFAFYQYLRQNKTLFSKVMQSGFWQGLKNFLAWARDWSRGARQQVEEVLQSGLQRLRTGLQPSRIPKAFHFVNPNRMTPRQRVLFIYLALIRRAEEAGIPRSMGETPSEYQQTLQSFIEKSEQPADPASLEELTRSFQEARYSQHAITSTQAKQVHSAWERLRQFFRDKK